MGESGGAASVGARARALWRSTQQLTLLVAAKGQWILIGRRLTMHTPWSLPTVKTVGPLTGPNPQDLLRQLGASRPDYVVPDHQLTRHLAYPAIIKPRDLPALLQLEGSRHTPFAAECLVMNYRRKRPRTGAEHQEITVSYCLREELTRLRQTLGACAPRWGFMATFGDDPEHMLDDQWWRLWSARAGVFVEDGFRGDGLRWRHFLFHAMLMPFIVAALIGPGFAIWHARVALRAHEIETLYRQEAKPLRIVRTHAGAVRRLHRTLVALRRYVHHATVPQWLLPRLVHALPATATLVSVRYDATNGHMRMRIRTTKAAGFLSTLDRATQNTTWHMSGMPEPVNPTTQLITVQGQWTHP